MSKRYSLGSTSIGELEKKYVNEVLDENYVSPGPVVKHVEEECARLHGMKHGLALNSGQAAIHVAIQAIVETKLKSGKEKPLVAVPACTYISTLAAAVLAGCDLILVDVEEDTGNMCPNQLKETLERHKKQGDPIDIVIPVHLYGRACNPRIFTICEEFGVWVVEDACESTFALGIGKGHILTTSFFSNHLISAGGGGVIMTNDSQLDEYCWKLINHGRSARFGNNDIHQIADKFCFDIFGHSMKWSDLPAALAKAQIERKNELYGIRRRNAKELIAILEDWKDYIILPLLDDHTFMMFMITLQEPLDVNNVIRYLNDNSIEVRRAMPITNQKVVREYFGNNDLVKEFPVADFLNRQSFYIGVHPELSLDDIQDMGSTVSEALRGEINRVEA